jgi:hypothetical protein
VFLRDLETERSVATGQAQHSSIHTELWSGDSRTTASDSDRREQQRHLQEMPEQMRLIHVRAVVGGRSVSASAIRCNSGIYRGL